MIGGACVAAHRSAASFRFWHEASWVRSSMRLLRLFDKILSIVKLMRMRPRTKPIGTRMLYSGRISASRPVLGWILVARRSLWYARLTRRQVR